MNIEQLTQLIQNKLQNERETANRLFNEGDIDGFDLAGRRIADLVVILEKLNPPPTIQPDPTIS